MKLRHAGGGLFLFLVAVPLSQFSCSGEEREFQNSAGASNGGSAGAASGGASGFQGGGSSGTAGDSSGGSAGADGGQPCSDTTECEDANPCNGAETCSGGYCVSGTPLADGTDCTPQVDGGVGTGEYACASNVCAAKCATDDDCNDGSVCTGNEICNPTTKTCQSGTPLVCEDNDPCTTNDCDDLAGCFYPVIDADGDGHAATSLGSCGTDCDDNDAAIYTSAAELCDNKDNNCNGSKDETAPFWYVDCDKDSFAASGAASIQQCDKPANVHSSCGATGGWTDKAPGKGTTDCWDKDAKAHPMTASENNSAWQTVAITGQSTLYDYDYNCDGKEERKFGANTPSTGNCTFYWSGKFGYCSGPSGYTGTTIPACGATGTYSSCNIINCSRQLTLSYKQPCR